MKNQSEVAVVNTVFKVYYKETGRLLRNMKLQKLMYFSSGVYAAENDGNVLIEKFETWPYGPVHSDTYEEFRHYGSDYIDKYARWAGDNESYYYDSDSEDIYTVIFRVVRKLGGFGDWDLSELTHQAGSPWSQCDLDKREVISTEKIIDHFREHGNEYAI